MRSALFAAVALLLVCACGERAPEAPPLDPEVAALVFDLVEGTDYDKRMAAHEALIAHGAVVVRPLADALDRDDVDAGVGAWIAEVLGGIGEAAAPAGPALGRRLLQGGECSATTSWALGQIGKAGVPHLIGALRAEQPKARIWASQALRVLDEPAPEALEALLPALGDPEPEVRANAAYEMADHPAAADRWVPPLLRLTRDASEDVRLAAAESLAEVAGDRPEVLARLRAMVLGVQEGETLRRLVLRGMGPALGKGPAELAFLREVIAETEEDSDLPDMAREMLLARGVDDPDLVTRMADLSSSASFDVRLERARALAGAGPNGRRAAPALLVHVLRWAPTADERVAAARLLGELGAATREHEAAMQVLAQHASAANDEPAVNAACAAALERLKRP